MRTTVSALLACTAACASPALAQTAAATPDIAALQAQIQAMQQQLNQLQAAQAAQATATAAAPAQAPAKTSAASWTDNTKISGKAFFNVSNIDQASDGANSGQNVLQTELKRFYIGVDHKVSDVLSANVTTDFRYNANGTSKDVRAWSTLTR